MNREERHKIIEEIEKERESTLLVYVAGDRRGMETKIASEIFPLFFNHLSNIGHQKSIDLLLYSTGGITMAGYGLVNLIRGFCDKFNVIIPFKAYSCATLITLGADEVIMTKMGQLSPIDPSIEHPLGPIVPLPSQPGMGRIVPVNVEDVNAYLDLAKLHAKLENEESMTKVFEQLSSKVNPLVLGAVYRARQQIKFLAEILLSYHMKDKKKIKDIVDTLTKERFSHDYLIGVKEAKNVLNLNVIDVPQTLNEKIMKLYNEYRKLLSLDTPYNPEVFLGSEDTKIGNFDRAIIESKNLTHLFRTVREVQRAKFSQPGIPIPIIGFQERSLKEEWVVDTNI